MKMNEKEAGVGPFFKKTMRPLAVWLGTSGKFLQEILLKKESNYFEIGNI